MPDLTTAFWIDADYDREYASDGRSRFAAYVRDRTHLFAESWEGTWDDGAVPFAVTAWRTATTPVMAPGYVRSHPRILSAEVIRNDWDGSLAADVSLVSSWPASLAAYPHTWEGGQHWQDWRTEYRFASEQYDYYEPSGEDVTRRPYLLASARLCFSLPDVSLLRPQPQWVAQGLEEAAAQTVARLVRGLNEAVGPVLARIEAGQ